MRKTLRKALVASAVVAAGIGVSASPASAADASWAVVNGGDIAAESTNTSLRVVRNNATLTCASVAAAASIPTTSGHAGPGIGSISETAWETCRGPLNLTFGVAQSGSWAINAVGPRNATSNFATISGINATINGAGCTATFTGSVRGYYDNSNGNLVLDPAVSVASELKATSVSGCLGIIQANDTALFSGTFATDPNNVDVVYSP
ncbi:hypothetical protein GCM10010191_23810 [Actinomadura vinacea]|uniref:Secreted protein n=1 Tax=Actinomadura vinacea TaxID=115336 RepID=A0ABN3IVB6_9ACTN